MTSYVEGVVAKLPKMSQTDLIKVRQLTDMLLGGTTTTTQADNPIERILFEALRAELASTGIRNNVTYSSFSESKYFKSWKRGVQIVSEFIERSFSDYAKTEIQRVGLCRILIQTMIREFKSRNIPVSIGSLANNLHRIPQTFDRAFPGYLESGLAYLIPMQLLQVKKNI